MTATAVITGAGRGLGRVIARRLQADGFDVLATDRDARTVELVGEELGVRTAEVDVTDEVSVARLTELAPNCTVIVNNAALTLFDSLLDTSSAAALRVLDVNVVGMLNVARVLSPIAAANGGGVIVNLSSITSRAHPPATGIYSASKAAVEQLTRALAVELGPLGIRCNSVAPGAVVTEGSSEHYGDEERLRRRAAVLPLGRLGQADDIAAAVSWLCSPESSYISGQVIAVDGGFGASAGQHFRLARGDS